MAPDKIYISETPNKLIEIWSDEPIESKPYITEHEYIRKNALLGWAKEELGNTSILRSETIETLQKVIDKLNSM